jgi:isopenicillin N synthase-like dioxygenase
MRVAVVDYAGTDACARFGRSMRATGFAVLVNHPLSPERVAAIRREWLAFFGMEAKHRYTHAEGGADGYFPVPDEAARTAGGVIRDRKEFFHVRPGAPYPSEVSDDALRHFESGMALAATLLGWLEDETPAERRRAPSMPLAQMIEGSAGSVLRVQHYLPLGDDEQSDGVRALAHEDINLITLLPAPSEPGLQVCDVNGRWHDIEFDARSLIVNGGEMLRLATGGNYPATPHRVLNPPEGAATGSRMSLPLFVHPAADVELAPGRTASAFLQERIDAMRSRGWAVVPGGRGVRT